MRLEVGLEVGLGVRLEVGLGVRLEVGLGVRLEVGLGVRPEVGLGVRLEVGLEVGLDVSGSGIRGHQRPPQVPSQKPWPPELHQVHSLFWQSRWPQKNALRLGRFTGIGSEASLEIGMLEVGEKAALTSPRFSGHH
jgi:hypothetical protein